MSMLNNSVRSQRRVIKA